MFPAAFAGYDVVMGQLRTQEQTYTRALKSSVVKSVKGLVKNIPALVTRRSILPKFSIAAATTLAAVSFFPISPAMRTRFDDAAKN